MTDVTAKDNQTSTSNPSVEISVEEVYHPTYSSEDEESNAISISSNLWTPFDTPLFTHSRDLRTNIDKVKVNICKALKLDINEFNSITPSMIKQSSTLNKKVIAEGLLSMLSLSEKVCDHVVDVSRPSDSVCSSKYVTSSPAVKEAYVCPSANYDSSAQASLQTIQDSIQDMKNSKSNDSALFKSIQEQLEELRLSIGQFKKPCGSDASSPEFLDHVPVPTFPVNLDVAPPKRNEEDVNNIQDIQSQDDPDVNCIKSHTENFIDHNTGTEILEYLDSQKEHFDKNTERGHSVISFGEVYTYPGAKAISPISKELPDILQKVVNSIKQSHPDCVINQCLVNRYVDQNAVLPQHSDNESSIVYGSDIFTLSIGATRDVVFKKLDGNGTDVVKHISGNSLYVMSRLSQNTWSHRIDPHSDPCDTRYSITLRYVSNHNDNVTVLLGDSNTRYLKFGSGKHTFGDKMPGKRVECFTLSQIKPQTCVGYKNVFVHCGINDIKPRNANVHDSVGLLISKLDSIRKLCPDSRITVSPILPTKLPVLNEKAVMFNSILFKYCNTISNIGTLDFNCFCDKDNLLGEKFGRYFDRSDNIHLGSTGIFMLSRLMARKLFSNPVDGRLYGEVAKLGATHRSSFNIPNSRISNSHNNDY